MRRGKVKRGKRIEVRERGEVRGKVKREKEKEVGRGRLSISGFFC